VSNRQLTDEEREFMKPLLVEVRAGLRALAGSDDELYWAMRRKLYKELMYDERKKPMQRRALKTFKHKEQGNLCAECRNELPAKNVVLDRLEAMPGYTIENTRLLCRDCDYRIQQERAFT
jgi:ribosomal protein L44E